MHRIKRQASSISQIHGKIRIFVILEMSWLNSLNLQNIDCGGVFKLSSESQALYINSPNYPNNYPLNIECSYIFTVL